MNTYKRYRFPHLGGPPISLATQSGCTIDSISATTGVPDHSIEDLLAERGITVSRKAIRLWYPKHSLRSWAVRRSDRFCSKFGALYARRLKRKHGGYGDTFFIDEVFVKIDGKQHYLWRAVDQDGEVVDVYLQSKSDGAAAKRLFKRLLRNHGGEPRKIVTAHAAVSNLFNIVSPPSFL